MPKKPIKQEKNNKDKKNHLDINVTKLVSKGKKQSYLTLDDILVLFPNAEEDIDYWSKI